MAKFLPSFPTSFTQRTPCMLVLDASGSMGTKINGGARTRIDELNGGLRLLRNELREDETASVRVQLAIVSVGGPDHRARLCMDWTDATEFEPPVMEADGPTPLGQGMRLALHHVDRHKAELNQFGIPYTRPWIMVISDGEPSDRGDVWKAITEECRAAEAAKRCVIFPIGVEDGNLEMLQMLSNTRAARLSSTNFSKYFQWLSASLSCVSRSQGTDSVVLPVTDPWAYFAESRT